jgi:hypothetical protein
MYRLNVFTRSFTMKYLPTVSATVLLSLALMSCGSSNTALSTGQEVPVVIDDTGASAIDQAHFRKGSPITIKFNNYTDPLTVIISGNQVFLGDNIVGDVVGNQIIGLEGTPIANLDGTLSSEAVGISKTSGLKWPGAVIPYVFDASATTNLRNQFQQAVGIYNSQTVVRYVARTNQANYVRVVAGNGCSSYVGMMNTSFKPNGQEITLGSDGCGVGAALHEMGHAAGLIHEQSRSDRDNYINIDFSLIAADWKSQYNKETGELGNLLTSYDYNSIMHYGNSQVGGKWVFTSKSGNPTPQNIGSKGVLTASDIASFATIYGTGNGGGGGTTGAAFTSTIVPQHTTGKCLDVPNNNASNGLFLQQWDCNNTTAQSFEFQPIAGQSQTYLIKHVSSNFCLDLAAGSDTNNTPIQFYSCGATNPNQQWQLRGIPGNARTFQLVAKVTTAAGKNTLCADVPGVSAANGTHINGYSCLPTNSGQRNQFFQIAGFR